MSQTVFVSPGEVAEQTSALRQRIAGDLGGMVLPVHSLAERGVVGVTSLNNLGSAVAALQEAVRLQLGFAAVSIDAAVERACAADRWPR